MPPRTPDAPLTVRRVLGDGPCAEVGVPRTVATSEELFAVGGQVGGPSSGGAAAGEHGRRTFRVGVYRRDDLRCLYVLQSRWPVNSLAFHPRLPLLAIGTGSYDGGWSFEGELLLLDLDTGTVVSALADRREVRDVTWRAWGEGRVLDLALAPASDWELDLAAFTVGFDAVVERDDWSAVGDGTIAYRELDGPLRENAWRGSEAAAARGVARLCARAGLAWSPRRSVAAVEQLRDGGVVAALDGVRLESWSESGARVWAVRERCVLDAQRIAVGPDEEWAWAGAVRREWPGRARSPRLDGAVRYALRDGRPLEHLDAGFPAVLVARSDGAPALRAGRGDSPFPEVVFFSPAPGSREIGRLRLSRFAPYARDFPVRHATAWYLLDNEGEWLRPDPWISIVEPGAAGQDPAARRLFPLAWDGPAQAQGMALHGGPAVEVADGSGPALVHVVARHDAALRAFVVRRRLPDGTPDWVVPLEHPVTALESDTEGHTVFAALVSGDVVALDAGTGAMRWRQAPTLHGHPVLPLSLSSALPGRLVMGTADGRILDCATTSG